MSRRMFGILVAALLTTALHTPAWGESAADLLPFVPQDANTVSVLRVKELIDSPRGRQEGWAEKHEREFLDGAVTVPPWVELLVRGSRVRPGTPGGLWTVVLLPLPAAYRMTALAEQEGTQPQLISGRTVVLSRRYNGYFVEWRSTDHTPRILGGISPATRQDAAHWIVAAHRAAASPALSDYLTEAAGDESAQIVLAIDLHEMLDPAQIRFRLEGAEALKDRPDDKAAVASLLQTLRGVRLAVRVDEAAAGEIRMDFEREVGDEGRFIKPLLIELLHDAGARLDELDDARDEVAGRSVTLRMPLSDESLRRVLSLVTAPHPPASGHVAPDGTTSKPVHEKPETDVVASRRYFSAVNRNIDDLQRSYRRSQQTYARTAQWHDNFAQRIDQLPTAGVDPDLIEYAAHVSSLLRSLAASLRGTGVQLDAENRTAYFNVNARPVYTGAEMWWGVPHTAYGPWTAGRPVDVRVDTNLPDVRARQTEIVMAAAPDRQQIWQMINDERAAVERKMVARFGQEFRQ